MSRPSSAVKPADTRIVQSLAAHSSWLGLQPARHGEHLFLWDLHRHAVEDARESGHRRLVQWDRILATLELQRTGDDAVGEPPTVDVGKAVIQLVYD